MTDLPINNVLAEIQRTLLSHNRVVLQAPPGAGKTTAVPLALLEQPWLQNKQIIMLEPRRIAARNAANRMAYLLDEKVGQTIGYQIRQDSKYSENTRILVVTEGILTRKLQADPELKNIALVIFDEFHERSLHADLSLALCLQSQHIIRDDLKILLMSATLNIDTLSQLLADTDKRAAPVIESKGRSFPVDIQYLEKSIKQTDPKQLNAALINTVKHVIHHHAGNCLVFLPGVREIKQLTKQIEQYLNTEKISTITVAPLYGNLSKQQQDQAISPPPASKRKIVLATNIAETSLTIEGIDCVIDSGLERISHYSPSSGMNRLLTQHITQDSSIQRSGRAGRLSAGVCYRLWTVQQQQRLQKHSAAEILHSDLCSLILELANWGVYQTDELRWLDLPPASASEQARTLLQQLNAFDEKGEISQHGRDMLNLGTHPRLAHMLLQSIKLKQSYLACLIASVLTEKDLFQANADKSYDMHDRIRILQSNNKIDRHTIDATQHKKIIQGADEFFQRLKLYANKTLGEALDKNFDDDFTGVLLAFAYPDRIAKQRHHDKPDYLLSNGKGASIPPFLQHHLYDYLVIADLDAGNNKAKRAGASIYLAAEISQQQLQDHFADSIDQAEVLNWNETHQRVEAKQITSIGKITLQEKIVTPEDKTIVHQHLIEAIKSAGLSCLNWSSQSLQLKQRINFINAHSKTTPALKNSSGYEKLPDFSESVLLDTISEWLLPFLSNENSIKQCLKLDLHSMLLSQLNWQQQQLVDRLAPEKFSVPSGSSISIDYSDATKPVLAVRLQEVFGLYETPSILDGHVRLMMHLLSPARRPMQVTQDLHSFWQTTYHDVKKELRGKYKKHYWPDDPFTATATSKTKKHMDR